MTCKDCGSRLNKYEIACPHCGSRMPVTGEAHGWLRWGWFVLLAFGALFLFSGVALRVHHSYLLPVSKKNASVENVPVRAPYVQSKQIEVRHEEGKPHSETQSDPTISSKDGKPAKLIEKRAEARLVREPDVKGAESDMEPVEIPATQTPGPSDRLAEDDLREQECELEILNTLKRTVQADIQNLDFNAAAQKIKTADNQFTTRLGAAYHAALKGLLIEAEGFHLWLSKKVVGFRFSRGGIVEKTDRQSLCFAGTSMPWTTFYLNRTELVGDMINNLVLSAMATKTLSVDEKGLLLIQTSAFLTLYYPEKAYASDKTEEILALVLENCTNQVAKVQALFPEFYSSFTNGTFFAKERLTGSGGVEKSNGPLLGQAPSLLAPSAKAEHQRGEPPTEAVAIKKATTMVNDALSSYPAALEARYVTARPCFQSFMGESLKRYTPRLILTFNFRYRTPSGRERWNLGPVNVAYDTVEKRWVMMGFCEATITGQNFLDTQEGQQAVQVAVNKAVRSSDNSDGKNRESPASSWKKNDLRSYDSRHPRNK